MDVFIQEEIPYQNNRRFYPRSNVIHSVMCRTMKLLRKSVIDQECLMTKIVQWNTEDSSKNFYLHSKYVDEKLLFEKEEINFKFSENKDYEMDIRLKGKEI